MDENVMACRHLAQFFEIAIEYNLDEVDFVLKALCSEYKYGIENFRPQWYSQSKYYYFEEFLEENIVKEKVYNKDEIIYKKEVMYWLGYCLQTWSNKANLKGEYLAKILSKDGIKYLIRNYDIYHTVDCMYVLEDCIDCLNLDIVI